MYLKSAPSWRSFSPAKESRNIGKNPRKQRPTGTWVPIPPSPPAYSLGLEIVSGLRSLVYL